jgi:DNA-binding CsgD family transcriptional regulator
MAAAQPVINGHAQPVGRPLAASEAQQATVRRLRKAGKSLRWIAEETSLGLNTVRTIVGKVEQRREHNRRTADRRRVARHAAKHAMGVPRCDQCHEPIEAPLRLRSRESRYDRPQWARRYCSDRCRQAAFRDRRNFPR